MSLPAVATKVHLDASSDDPSQARAELVALIDKFNALLSALPTAFATAAQGTLATNAQPAATAINTGNIGSQSVNYATSAGNADTLDGNHASAFATTSNITTAINAYYGHATNGYERLPSGLYIQWGETAIVGSSGETITFPVAFPVTCLQVVITPTTSAAVAAGVQSMTASNFFIMFSGSPENRYFRWFAIGY